MFIILEADIPALKLQISIQDLQVKYYVNGCSFLVKTYENTITTSQCVMQATQEGHV